MKIRDIYLSKKLPVISIAIALLCIIITLISQLILSTYMGHKNIYGTETYLHATAVTNVEILQKMFDYNVGIFPEVDL